MTDLPADPDALLAECATEPIHIPGGVQPHGVVLVTGPDGRIVQASANAVAWFGRDSLGLQLAEVLPAVASALAEDGQGNDPLEVLHALDDGRGRARITGHRLGPLTILDLEPEAAREPDRRAVQRVSEMAANCAGLRELPLVAQVAAEAVAAMTGYDRVMVYRFHADGHGEVIAEALAPGVASFNGLHYPASDIPPQARALFLANRVRVIVDASATAAPLVPRDNPLTGQPLDLTRSALRASSPVHLEYLRNMEVGASLSAAIAVDGRLWGLVACHHRSPRDASHTQRALADLAASVLAARISDLEARRVADAAARADRLQRELLSTLAMGGSMDWMQDVMRQELIMRVVPSTGVALFHDGALRSAGLVPGEAELRGLEAWLRTRVGDDAIGFDRLGDHLPALRGQAAVACGALAARFDGGGMLVWLRPEWVRTVVWGGDPRKAAQVAQDGSARLSPRRSFAAWAEQVRGSADPWTVEDLAGARAVAANLQVVIQRVYSVRRVLLESNRRLSDFAHVAAHDLQEPLRTVRGFADLILRRAGRSLAAQPMEHLRLLIGAAERMQLLIRDLLAYANVQETTAQRVEVDLSEVAQEAQAALRQAISESDARIEVGPLPVVRGVRRLLIQLLQNLIGNALKYRSAEVPRVRIAARRDAGRGGWEVSVSDNGIGVAVQNHQRIFEVFQRGGQGADVAGTGIGLAICRSIVEAHGGSIWVESAGAGGATFRFTIDDAAAQ